MVSKRKMCLSYTSAIRSCEQERRVGQAVSAFCTEQEKGTWLHDLGCPYSILRERNYAEINAASCDFIALNLNSARSFHHGQTVGHSGKGVCFAHG